MSFFAYFCSQNQITMPTTFALFLFCLPVFFSPCLSTSSGHNIKGMFVFGSSLVDNGNNNFLLMSAAKANYLPYGIDFPKGASGRFTNGKNVIDLLGQHLNLPSLIPPFNDPSTRGSNILHGVNFASGGSGILDDTGLIAVREVINLNQQIKNFERRTLPELKAQKVDSVSNYLFVVGTGGNDYSYNYFLIRRDTSVEDFTSNLIGLLSQKLQRLYNLGGRKFVLMSANPLGCYPAVNKSMSQVKPQELNDAALLFNARLKSMVDSMNPRMPGASLVYVNSYKIISDIISNPASKGFRDTNGTCCEVRSMREGGNGASCYKGGGVCEDRKLHVFFDGVHPTEAVNVEIANKAFSSNLKEEVYPINVQQLVDL